MVRFFFRFLCYPNVLGYYLKCSFVDDQSQKDVVFSKPKQTEIEHIENNGKLMKVFDCNIVVQR